MQDKDLSLLQPYCENDMYLLKKISRSIFMKFREPLGQADYDDFYSTANMTLWKAYNAYDPGMGVSFEGFLYSCLQKKFKTEIVYRHRHKRVLNRLAVPMDTVNDNGEEFSLMDVIPSDFDTFEEVMKEQEYGQYRDKVQMYISRLSKRQVNILNFLVDGFKPCEIRRILGISQKEYSDSMEIMRSYENVKVLY